MGLLFGTVRQAAVGRTEGDVAIGAAGPPGDDGALHLLNGGDTGEGPEVGIAYPWKVFCVDPLISPFSF